MIDTSKYTKNGPHAVYIKNTDTGRIYRQIWAYKPIYDGDYIRIPVKTLYSFTVYSYPRKTHKIVTIKNM